MALSDVNLYITDGGEVKLINVSAVWAYVPGCTGPIKLMPSQVLLDGDKPVDKLRSKLEAKLLDAQFKVQELQAKIDELDE